MCDTFVALGGDGVLLGKNSDREPNEAQQLRWYAASDPIPGGRLRCTWSSVPQVAHTHAVVLSQPWWMWGAEMGANEHGVVVGNEAVHTRRTGARERTGEDGALLGMDLVRLALERAATRHEAVEVVVGLLERHGQGGPCSWRHRRTTYDNSFLVADRDGAVVLETAGRHHAAEEVTGPGRAISNALTIDGFARRFADPLPARVARATSRRAVTTRCATRATSVAEVVTTLRDHGPQGLAWHPLTGSFAGPCGHAAGVFPATQSTASWVADTRHDRHWVTGTSAPCTGLFRPVTVHGPTDDEPRATDRYDPAVAWWRHERLHRRVLRHHPAPYAAGRDALEADWFRDPPDPAVAAAEAERRRAGWLDDLGEERDTRPAWVQARWRRWDAEAGLLESGA